MQNKFNRNKLIKPPAILIYSEAGIGKTTFASKAPRPVFLRTEDGLGSLDVDCSSMIKSVDELVEYIEFLTNEEHDYKTVVVDSLDHLEILVHNQVCENFKIKSIEALGYGRGYVEAMIIWQYIFALLDALRNKKNMMLVLIAHSEVRSYNDPTSESYDRYQIKLHKKAAALAIESVDCVLFATYQSIIQRDRNNRVKASGTGERIMYTEARPSLIAKNRYNLPCIMQLDMKVLLEKINV